MRYIDDLEMMYTQAYCTALSGAFDEKGKPIIKSFKDLFDRKKVEQTLLDGTDIGKKRVNPEDVEAFRKSKEFAESVLNGITIGEEDV
ncbi:hypothetical protein [Macrococcus capreoli]|uniref:hypothetical protein n=1 Tax=Macrococcus capreoli TaxID=2982690 RepID=UPI0021D5AB2D|nr:hypothetical protein [Macrococcus sp. TMW 2.2395]MCU7556530.1 hypothetical protein [Macrococcus sp. TMW 2.2395]